MLAHACEIMKFDTMLVYKHINKHIADFQNLLKHTKNKIVAIILELIVDFVILVEK
jgi:hypothetical protein